MIDLYFWPTPNGLKISIALEELGLPYRVVPVNIGRGAQFEPSFLAISPNNRMPAIVDHDPLGGGAPLSIFESGAILQYLAEKARALSPTDVRGRYEVAQWVFWQVAGLGPMAGQLGHFKSYAKEKIPYAIDRYENEVRRLHDVMEKRLADRAYLAGDYSIADIASYPWMRGYAGKPTLEDRPNVRRWLAAIEARPAVQRGLAVGADLSAGPPDAESRKHLFDRKY
jgi:GST-like protein